MLKRRLAKVFHFMILGKQVRYIDQ